MGYTALKATKPGSCSACLSMRSRALTALLSEVTPKTRNTCPGAARLARPAPSWWTKR